MDFQANGPAPRQRSVVRVTAELYASLLHGTNRFFRFPESKIPILETRWATAILPC